MPHITSELSNEWVNYARASMATRIEDTEKVAGKVVTAVQAIAMQLDDKQQLKSLMDVKGDEIMPEEVLPILKDVLSHLNKHDKLSQLIAPLYITLQFEDRTRQKLEGLLDMLTTWSEVRNDETLTDETLANKLMSHVVAMEQQEILAKYFPDYITVEETEDEVDFF